MFIEPNPYGRPFVDADTQKLGVLQDHRYQAVLPPARHEVLVDDHALEETEALPQLDVISCDDGEITVARDHETALTRRAGRRTPPHVTAGEGGLHRLTYRSPDQEHE